MKKISTQAKSILRGLDMQTVSNLTSVFDSIQQKTAVLELVRYLNMYEQDYLASLDSADEHLSVKHANSKGRMAALTLLVHILEGSKDEAERRDKDNE